MEAISMLEYVERIVDTLGFPALMVFYFIWDKTKLTNKLTNAVETLVKTVDNNTTVMAKLIDKFDLSVKVHDNE